MLKTIVHSLQGHHVFGHLLQRAIEKKRLTSRPVEIDRRLSASFSSSPFWTIIIDDGDDKGTDTAMMAMVAMKVATMKVVMTTLMMHEGCIAEDEHDADDDSHEHETITALTPQYFGVSRSSSRQRGSGARSSGPPYSPTQQSTTTTPKPKSLQIITVQRATKPPPMILSPKLEKH